MSKIIASAAIRGAHYYMSVAQQQLARAIELQGPQTRIGFPNTAYHLPLILALLGKKVDTLKDCEDALAEAQILLPEVPSEALWLPYLGSALDAGIATLVAEEIIEALKYLDPKYSPTPPFIGFTDDSILRNQGIKLVDGRMPGFAACVGALPTNEQAVALARELQEKSILVFMAGSSNGKSMAEQLAEEGVEMGWDTYLVPYGKDMSSAVYALNFAARAAMTFGGVKPGDLDAARQILMYNKERVFAFVLALGIDPEVSANQLLTDQKYATAAGAINYGFPVIADSSIPQILPRGICTYEHVVSNISLDRIVPKAVEVRGLKLKASKIPIPIAYGAAFEGERVRKENLHVEFGGKYSTAFEYLRARPMDQVEDGKVTLVGPDIDQAKPGKAMPLGIFVEVAGRSFHEDFESVLERRVHKFVSCASGIMHIGQRDIPWIRISAEAFQKGFRLKHLGELLIHKYHDEFSGIVDKVQVTVFTDEKLMQEVLKEAREAYRKRDERMEGMKDVDVDRFYSCILCQSYAPNHVCIVTPQRLGLCGAYTWLDCRAAHEMDAHGPNQPIPKGFCIDPNLGVWQGVNDYVAKASNGHLQQVTMYSIMQDPQTSCGCFECLVAVLPETNGVMIVNREFQGMTPIGMSFSTMAGEVGGGVQTPGFLGVGRMYLVSEKFISAEGGLQRLVWMPQELKDEMRDRLEKRLGDMEQLDLLDKIATENEATAVEELVEFLQKVEHPALSMESVLG